MSNPLLRPDDPRFKKPSIVDGAGQNPFAEEAPVAPQRDAKGNVLGEVSGSLEERPYVPQYEAQQAPRKRLLIVLAGLSWVGVALGLTAISGLYPSGIICPILGLGPAAAAWFLAYEDLKAIRVGAVEEDAKPQIRLAFWLGFAGFVASISVLAVMIWRQMALLPDVF